MKINYNKSDLTPVNLDEEETQEYAKKKSVVKLGLSLLDIWGYLSTMRSLRERIFNQLWIRY
jgi:hypothetical protein